MAPPQTRSLTPDLTIASHTPARRRLVLGVDGLDKHGKTTFALSAPKPLVYLDFDIGREGVLEKAPGADRILASAPFLFRPSEVGWDAKSDAERTARIMAAAEPELDRFRRTYLHALTQPVMEINGTPTKARTVVIDTGGEAWELIRLCYFGKVSQVKPHHYVECNGLMRDLVRAAFDSDVNVIWLHKLKAEWKEGIDGKGKKSGTFERAGFTDMSYLVQANLLAYRIPEGATPDHSVKWKSGEGTFDVVTGARDPEDETDQGFRILCGNSRHDATLEGTVWGGPLATFPMVAASMVEGTTPADWE